MLRFLRGGNKRTKTIWWVLIVVTVVTFLGGFVFLFGAGFDTTRNARMTGAVGTVNGESISRQEYQIALEEQREGYKQQFGGDAVDRDARVVELQAWRSLVTQRLVSDLARKEGIKAYDSEVVLSLETSPPNALASNPSFQTDGKFDAQKYTAALRNPGNNWAPFEAMIREQLPVRKLEQRMLASIKLSRQELEQEFASRSEHITATVVQVPPSSDPAQPQPTAADLDRAYAKFKSRFYTGLRVQLEALMVPRQYSDEDLRAAKQLAQSLVDRARRGEDFAQLAKDYSEGPGAEKGGVIDRVLQPADFGIMGQHLSTLRAGQVSDPFQDAGRFLIVKVLARVPGTTGPDSGMKVAQIVVRARGSDAAAQDQFQSLQKIRNRAARIGLGRAAAEAKMGTMRTQYYDSNSPPPELFSAPEAAEWGLRAKVGQVSPVYSGIDEFVIVSPAARHEPGPASKDEMGETLRQIADQDMRVDRARPRADSLAARLAQGGSLEQAAKAGGLQPITVSISKAQPDPRVASATELIGTLYAAPPGRVVGPVRTAAGWYFGRVEQRAAPDTTAYDKQQSQIQKEVLTRRQQLFFAALVNGLAVKAKVQDLRYEATQ